MLAFLFGLLGLLLVVLGELIRRYVPRNEARSPQQTTGYRRQEPACPPQGAGHETPPAGNPSNFTANLSRFLFAAGIVCLLLSIAAFLFLLFWA
ncbi:hypothetical protein LJC49_00870 [Ruminococcaceae bacterium OttesenSCG-928-I18]|nr:hypothetical protein [Ruminococcaceae bacterium OttesenSCG-928-I18]